MKPADLPPLDRELTVVTHSVNIALLPANRPTLDTIITCTGADAGVPEEPAAGPALVLV
ncbi:MULTISPECIES: hypothetical protein [Saccharothrix]|uniref:hypothetical protein n=1 Tax=Saccharothrix TaxID=2071 RepID=UPI0018E972F6|nr:hypothetical protein [Saccharothrix sp. CB00851]